MALNLLQKATVHAENFQQKKKRIKPYHCRKEW